MFGCDVSLQRCKRKRCRGGSVIVDTVERRRHDEWHREKEYSISERSTSVSSSSSSSNGIDVGPDTDAVLGCQKRLGKRRQVIDRGP